MFKRIHVTGLLIAALFCGTASYAQQGSSYSTGLGMHLDLGDGNLYGFSAKHFFSPQLAGHGTLLFGSGVNASEGAELQYHVPIAGAPGLKWYVGGGLQVLFYKYGAGTGFWIRPMGGLDYKINSAPIDLSFDWRPTFVLNNGGGSDIGRFGLGVRFTL
jgi:hypothetical protein